MIPRLLLARLRQELHRFPVVALLGPRQVGKTTLALALAEELGEAAAYVDLELPSDRAKLTDPELYFPAHEGRLLILDEIHRTPGIFQPLRGVVDRRRRTGLRAGQFLLLGSASIDLLRQSAETLAGRIAYLELAPLSVPEVAATGPEAVDRLWIRGGFPDSFLAGDEETSLAWRQAFIQTYLARDLPALGPRVPAETIGRFWQMLAHEQGQLLNAARLASALGVSGQTVARYLDTLVDLLLVRRLSPWTPSGHSGRTVPDRSARLGLRGRLPFHRGDRSGQEARDLRAGRRAVCMADQSRQSDPRSPGSRGEPLDAARDSRGSRRDPCGAVRGRRAGSVGALDSRPRRCAHPVGGPRKPRGAALQRCRHRATCASRRGRRPVPRHRALLDGLSVDLARNSRIPGVSFGSAGHGTAVTGNRFP